MVSWNLKKYVKPFVYYSEGECLSADEKPTEGVSNGSKLLEMDTGKLYMFDAENGTWVEWEA